VPGMKKEQSHKHRALALLSAVGDIAPPGHPSPIPIERANSTYRAIFRRYVSEMRRSKKAAEDWWDAIVETETERNRGGRGEALRQLLVERPLGALSYGEVIATVRKYWLECAATNRQSPEAERVPPECLVLAWLDAGNDELAQFLSGWTFWPMGLDESGNWV